MDDGKKQVLMAATKQGGRRFRPDVACLGDTFPYAPLFVNVPGTALGTRYSMAIEGAVLDGFGEVPRREAFPGFRRAERQNVV